jgi:23S rRNA (pseudouridine1915-N3)-methyltransferase
MKIVIAAIGKAKAGPELQLYHDYVKRLPWKIAVKEAKDAAGLLAACAGYERVIALDESGRDLSSREFAGQLKTWQQQGHSSFAFIIGGADGLDDSILKKAHLRWSLGRVTWPHMLVRGLLAEQLYRAHSIISNHPYHRD